MSMKWLNSLRSKGYEENITKEIDFHVSFTTFLFNGIITYYEKAAYLNGLLTVAL